MEKDYDIIPCSHDDVCPQSETFLYPARVEHVFRVIKRQFGFTKTRYRGLMKNTVQVNMLMGLANLYLLRRRLMAA